MGPLVRSGGVDVDVDGYLRHWLAARGALSRRVLKLVRMEDLDLHFLCENQNLNGRYSPRAVCSVSKSTRPDRPLKTVPKIEERRIRAIPGSSPRISGDRREPRRSESGLNARNWSVRLNNGPRKFEQD